MPPKKVKFGKRINVFLSNECLQKAIDLSENRSALIESLILKQWALNKKKLERRYAKKG